MQPFPSASVQFIGVRSRQLEGTYPGDGTMGAWGTTALRVIKGWGVPDESAWPYDGDISHWPPTEPPGIDQLAKLHRILAYQRARSIDECRRFLAGGHPVIAAFEIDNSWFSAPSGVIPVPSQVTPVIGSHAIDLVGYDDEKGRFIVRNSWGIHWGYKGHGYLPYEYLSERFLEGWVIPSDDPRQRVNFSSGVQVSEWGIPDLLGGILHGFEIIDGTNNEIVGWAFAVERDGYLDVEELFVRPLWRGFGYGRRLTTSLKSKATVLRRPLRLWIAHCDADSLDKPQTKAVFDQIGLEISPSHAKWAPYVGVSEIQQGGI